MSSSRVASEGMVRVDYDDDLSGGYVRGPQFKQLTILDVLEDLAEQGYHIDFHYGVENFTVDGHAWVGIPFYMLDGDDAA